MATVTVTRNPHTAESFTRTFFVEARTSFAAVHEDREGKYGTYCAHLGWIERRPKASRFEYRGVVRGTDGPNQCLLWNTTRKAAIEALEAATR